MQVGHDSTEVLRTGGSRPSRRQQLLDVAAELVLREGLDSVRPTRIAESVGRTRPLVYQYFRSREELLLCLAAEFYNEIDRHWDILVQRTFDPAQTLGSCRDLIEEASDARVFGRTLAGLTVRVCAARSALLGPGLTELKSQYEARWKRSLGARGLSPDRVDLALEGLFAGALEVGMRVRERSVGASDALEDLSWLLRSLVVGTNPRHS